MKIIVCIVILSISNICYCRIDARGHGGIGYPFRLVLSKRKAIRDFAEHPFFDAEFEDSKGITAGLGITVVPSVPVVTDKEDSTEQLDVLKDYHFVDCSISVI